MHKDPLQRNEQGQYIHHGIRLAFQASTLSHSVHQLGYAATEAAETFRQMAKMFERFRDVDLTELGKSIKELTRQRFESSKDIDVKELGETIKAATRQRLEGKTKEPFEPQEHIDPPY